MIVKPSRGGRPSSGSVSWRRDPRTEAWQWFVRLSLSDGTRPYVALDPSIPREDEPAARACARAVSDQARETSGCIPRGGQTMTEWFDEWLLTRRAKGQTSTRENDSHYREHIRRVLGDVHIAAWTKADLRAVSRALDTKVQSGTIKWKTASNVWGTATKMCADAVRSKVDALRVRSDNPASDVPGPDRGARTVKQYLYPSEFLRFVGCADVPVLWRRIVALMVYLYPRPGELRELRLEDVDLAHGTVHLHQATDRVTGQTKETKTGQARRFSVEAQLLPLLRAMHAERRGLGRLIEMPCDRDLARGFRTWLLRAGVTRTELHKSTPTRKAITVYDLRATGITWLAIRGDEPLRMMQRAGHRNFATTQGYIREAEAVREGFGDVFPALPGALLEASGVLPQFCPGPPEKRGFVDKSQRRGRDSNPRLGFIPAPA